MLLEIWGALFRCLVSCLLVMQELTCVILDCLLLKSTDLWMYVVHYSAMLRSFWWSAHHWLRLCHISLMSICPSPCGLPQTQVCQRLQYSLKCSDFSRWHSLTWSGCGLPHRQVCLAPSVREPLFRSRGPEDSSPLARSGWSRTSRHHQIPQSTPWTKNTSNL